MTYEDYRLSLYCKLKILTGQLMELYKYLTECDNYLRIDTNKGKIY